MASGVGVVRHFPMLPVEFPVSLPWNILFLLFYPPNGHELLRSTVGTQSKDTKTLQNPQTSNTFHFLVHHATLAHLQAKIDSCLRCWAKTTHCTLRDWESLFHENHLVCSWGWGATLPITRQYLSASESNQCLFFCVTSGLKQLSLNIDTELFTITVTECQISFVKYTAAWTNRYVKSFGAGSPSLSLPLHKAASKWLRSNLCKFNHRPSKCDWCAHWRNTEKDGSRRRKHLSTCHRPDPAFLHGI